MSSVAIMRAPIRLSSRAASFRERHTLEAQFPRINLLGSSVNRSRVAYYSLIFPVLCVLLAVLALWLPLPLPWLDPPLPWLDPPLPWLALHLPLPVVLCSEMARSVYGKDQKVR